jgi:C-terminal processing protease CtpA/Prc
VTQNTPAANHLHVGDVIIQINGNDATRLTHQQSHDLIANAGLALTLQIRKGQYQVIKATQKPIKYTQTGIIIKISLSFKNILNLISTLKGHTNLTILPVQNAYKRF